MGREGWVNRALDEPYIRLTFGLYSAYTTVSALRHLDSLVSAGWVGSGPPFSFLGFIIRPSNISIGQSFGTNYSVSVFLRHTSALFLQDFSLTSASAQSPA